MSAASVVAFGGLPQRNAQVQGGGVGRHEASVSIRQAAARGVRFINVSPVRDDAPDGVETAWLPIRPCTDTALLLALAFVLISESRHDTQFLDRCCVGFDAVRAYVLGLEDGIPKTPEWASLLCDVPPTRIVDLARDMASNRTMLMVNWAIQRADHGEQPYWMAITLAAILGQIGLPGGGFGFGYSATNGAGRQELSFRWPSLPQGRNPVSSVIPVARLADMLLNPGGQYDFDGKLCTYPDIRLVYWAGGNPFHHHQDLNRLVEAWQRPATIIVHEPYWTATGRRADIVLPVTTTLEREDLAVTSRDNLMVAMKRVIAPVGEARDDFSIFKDLAARLGTETSFTEGRDAGGWIKHLYEQGYLSAACAGVDLPEFEAFWEKGHFELEDHPSSQVFLRAFRADPEGQHLRTPSGRIELFSDTVASFGYDDCRGHAAWFEPREWLGSELKARFPLHLLSPQPADKLHSQYDHGSYSRGRKIGGRAALRMHPDDAAARGLREGDIVTVFNDRGACLAGVTLIDALLLGVVQLPTGAWFDPADPRLRTHSLR